MNYFRKRQNAFSYALKGLKVFFTTENHPRIHAVVSLLVIALASLLHVNFYEWLALIFCIALVLSMEAINSAMEKLTDLASPDYSKKAGEVKDIAAGAVLLTSIAAAIIGALIFVPRILALI